MYFKFELDGKEAIARIDLPPFFSSYVDRTSPICMFTAHQLRTYTTAHLSGGGWYLDCTLEFTPPSEVQLRRSLDGKGVVDLDIDEFAWLDDKARQKAIARRDLLTRRKRLGSNSRLKIKRRRRPSLLRRRWPKKRKTRVKARARARRRMKLEVKWYHLPLRMEVHRCKAE